MRRRQFLTLLGLGAAACVSSPSPTAIVTEPARRLERLGPYEFMSEEEVAVFLEDIQVGATDVLSQVAASKITGLHHATLHTNVELAQIAQDPLHLFVTSQDPENYLEPLHVAPVDRYVEPLDEPTPRPLYNGLTVGIGMPVRSPQWSEIPEFVKSLVATKELLGLGMVDDFSRWTYQTLKDQGRQFSIVTAQGQVISPQDQLNEKDIIQIGNFYFFQDIGISKQLRSVLWRLYDLMPALVVACGWQKKQEAGEVEPGAAFQTPATFVLLADRAKKTPYLQTNILDYVYEAAYLPMASSQRVKGEAGQISSLLSSPEIRNLILEVSALPEVYGPIQ